MGDNVTRVGATSTLVIPLGAYPSADGWISAGIITPREWDALAQWIYEVTGNEEVLNEAYQGGNQDRAPYNDTITALVMDFTTRYTSEYLFHEGQRRNLVFIPVTPSPTCWPTLSWSRATSGSASIIQQPHAPVPSGRVRQQRGLAGIQARAVSGTGQSGIYAGELGLTEAELSALKSEGVI